MRNYWKTIIRKKKRKMIQRERGLKIYRWVSCWGRTFKTIYRNISGEKFESEVYILDKFISPGSISFDIGASYGRYTLIMSRLVGKEGHVYSFEPGSCSHRVLSRAIRFHGLKNVSIVRKALSNRKGFANLVIPVKETGSLGEPLAYLDTGFDSECITEKVELTTLDDFCSENNISKVDFIKCDIEGSELLFFEGARGIIIYYKPTILFEISRTNLYRFNCRPSQILESFSIPDYNTFRLDGKKLEKVNYTKNSGNFFFIHNSKIKKLDKA